MTHLDACLAALKPLRAEASIDLLGEADRALDDLEAAFPTDERRLIAFRELQMALSENVRTTEFDKLLRASIEQRIVVWLESRDRAPAILIGEAASVNVALPAASRRGGSSR